jgi:ABC-type multidrug transport system ATPase subunit
VLTKRFRKLYIYRNLICYPSQRANHAAVDHVSLRIKQGELFGIANQNSGGKTTLVKMLYTSLLSSSGSAKAVRRSTQLWPYLFALTAITALLLPTRLLLYYMRIRMVHSD